MSSRAVGGFTVGDEVWCLAWVGKAFMVVDAEPAVGRISIEGPSATDPYGAQIDLPPALHWMLTHEPWDQVWHWPDRAGERYDTVVDRFIDGLDVGDVVRGYYLDTGTAALRQGMHVAVVPNAAITLRVQAINVLRGKQVWLEPVAPVDAEGRLLDHLTAGPDAAEYRSVGAAAPARVAMAAYRWSLSFGEFILNWQDFLPAE